MTESAWAKCKDPDRMLDFLLERTTERKYRLFALACVRRHADLLKRHRWAGRAIEAVERFIDGHLTRARMDQDASRFDAAAEEEDLEDPADSVSTAIWHLMTACKAIEGAARAKSKAAALCMASAAADRNDTTREEEQAVHAGLARCVFPFRSVKLNPDATAVQLARAAYEQPLPSGELDPVRLAVLADALEEAGADAKVVAHLRSPGPHVKGCWPVDLLLGKG